jgi:hypothetical protein
VQADLREVIERAKDARAVLGLGPNDGDAAARAAFHALCKRYHPARFARSSPETVRLANEAFLAIKRAYDGLVRPAPAARAGDRTGPIPRPAIAPPAAKAPAVARPPASAPVAPKPPDKPPPPPPTEEQRFAGALEMLRHLVWRDAERAFGELAVAAPADRRYRAYRHYARGRVAQDDGRVAEARAEWERALRLDPELAAARAAIDSLPEPPKPAGGFLSKLFKR